MRRKAGQVGIVALAVVAIGGGATLTGADNAGGSLVPQVQVPQVETPKLPPTPPLSPTETLHQTTGTATDAVQQVTGTVRTTAASAVQGAAPSAGSGSTGSSTGGGGTTGSPSGQAAASSPASGVGQAAPAGAPGVTVPNVGTAGSGVSRASGVAGGSLPQAVIARVRRAAQRRYDRNLRKTVQRLGGCLYALPAFEQKVLFLRAGLGARRPRSRLATARRLDTAVSRVARAERRGLRGLRTASERTGCSDFKPPTTPSLELGGPTARQLVASRPLAALAPARDIYQSSETVRRASSRRVLGTRISNEGPTTLATVTPDPRPASSTGDDSGPSPVLIGLLLSLALLALLAARSVMRHRRSVPVAQEAPPQLPEASVEEPPPSAPVEEPELVEEPGPVPWEGAQPDLEAAATEDQVKPDDAGPGWWEDVPRDSSGVDWNLPGESPPEESRRTRRAGGLLGPRITSAVFGVAERLRRRR